MKKVLSIFVNFLVKFLPIKENKLIFQTSRNKVDCGPYAVYRYIKDNNINNYRCIWLVEKNTDVSNLNIGDYCNYKSIKGLYHLATAKYWIRSQSIGSIIKKRKKQIYIQLFHGAGAFKKMGYDCIPKEERPTTPVEHTKEWDYLVTTDKYYAKALKSSTNHNAKTVVLGNLESDFLINFNNDDVERVLNKLKIKKTNKKIVMYAPTFRDFELSDNINELNLPIMKLANLKNVIVLIRVHPLVSKKIEKINLPKNFINVSDFKNINELFLIIDLLISDYSTIIFPYALLNKPMVFYPYDMNLYTKIRGGFYIDYNSLPGPICYTEDELYKEVENYEKNCLVYKNAIIEFNKKYNSLNDGNVCKKFIEKLNSNFFNKF